jgi:hypothetical protein
VDSVLKKFPKQLESVASTVLGKVLGVSGTFSQNIVNKSPSATIFVASSTKESGTSELIALRTMYVK